MKVQSTIYPKKIKILGEKVYVRDLNTVEKKEDENGTTIYSYNEVKMTKNEYIEILKEETDNLKNTVDILVLESLGL